MFKVQNPQGKLISLCFLVFLSSFLSNISALQVVQMAQWDEFNLTLFSQQYPVNPQNKPSAESPQVCDMGDNKYFTLNNKPKCRWSLYVCQQTLKQITRIDFSAQSLMPGTIVQLFADKVAQISFISYVRPLSIVLSNGINAIIPFIKSPKEWAQQLANFLTNFYQELNQRKIEIKVVQPGRMEKALQTLELSTAIYEHLLVARSNIYPLQLSKRILAVFHQKFFTTDLKLPNEGNLIEHFFGDSQGLAKEDPLNLILNPENPLEFISRANFGRLLVISVNSTETAEDQMADLIECTLKGTLSQNCVANVMKTILLNPTLRYYFAGMEESFPFVQKCEFCKATIEWESIFFPINASTVTKLRPLSAEAISFTGQPHYYESMRFFQTEDCSKQIVIIISKIQEGNFLSLRVSNNIYPANRSTIRPVRHLFNTTHPGTFQISSEVGKEVFDLKFLAKGRRQPIGMRFFFLKKVPIYSTQVEFALLINGEKKVSQIIGKSRSHKQFTQVNIRIDPQTQASRILFIQSFETDSPGEALRSAAPEIEDFNQFDY